jgi:hypothetical protein
LRFLHINCSQIYESPSVADISLWMLFLPMLNF